MKMILMIPVMRHPKRWWNFCMSEDTKNEKFCQLLLSNAFNVSVVLNPFAKESFDIVCHEYLAILAQKIIHEGLI